MRWRGLAKAHLVALAAKQLVGSSTTGGNGRRPALCRENAVRIPTRIELQSSIIITRVSIQFGFSCNTFVKNLRSFIPPVVMRGFSLVGPLGIRRPAAQTAGSQLDKVLGSELRGSHLQRPPNGLALVSSSGSFLSVGFSPVSEKCTCTET